MLKRVLKVQCFRVRVGSKEIQINETKLKANDSGVSPRAFLYNRKFGINSRDYSLHYKTNLIGDSPQTFPFFSVTLQCQILQPTPNSLET